MRLVDCISDWVWAKSGNFFKWGKKGLFTKVRMGFCCKLKLTVHIVKAEGKEFGKQRVSQDGRGWKGPLEITSSKSPAQVASP